MAAAVTTGENSGSDSGQGRLSGLLATGDAALSSPSQWPAAIQKQPVGCFGEGLTPACCPPRQRDGRALRPTGSAGADSALRRQGSAIAAENSGRPYSVAEHAAALLKSLAAEGCKNLKKMNPHQR